MAKKKNEVNNGDERLENVETALSKTEIWIEENQKIIYGIIAAVLIIAGVIFAIRYINRKHDQAASEVIFAAEKNFNNKEYEAALQGDENYPGFLEIYDSYSRTKTGKLAAYYAGICYMNLEKYDEAIDYLNKFNANDDILAPMALGAIGDCKMQLDKTEEAVTYYMKAVNKSKNEFTAPVFLNKAGMTYEILKDYGNALKCYKSLKTDYPLSNEAYEIDRKISKMEELLK